VLGWSRSSRCREVGWAVLLGISMIVAVGIAQEFVGWRHARVPDLVAGTLGATIGIVAAKRLARPGVSDPMAQSRRVHPWFLVAAGAWTLALVARNWHPFDFELTSDIVARRLTRMSLVPFAFYYWYASYTVNPLLAVHEAVRTFVSAVPLALLLRLAWPVIGERRVLRSQGVAITVGATTVLLAIEFGQMFLPTRFPDLTDVLIGATGAMFGVATGTALAARRQTTSGDTRPKQPVLKVVSAQCSSEELAQ
jgi:glycopeptide antibiotics resistance protein